MNFNDPLTLSSWQNISELDKPLCLHLLNSISPLYLMLLSRLVFSIFYFADSLSFFFFLPQTLGILISKPTVMRYSDLPQPTPTNNSKNTIWTYFSDVPEKECVERTFYILFFLFIYNSVTLSFADMLSILRPK